MAFVKTVEYGSFTKASENLHYSQSGISRMIGDLERDRDKASADRKLQYTIQIQSLQVSKKEAELNMKTKVAELEKARKLLDNATITSPVTGRIQAVNENGTDSQGNPAAYITIQQAGAYRVKGIIGELQQNALRQGDKVLMTSRVDSSKTWTGTVSQIDYENPVKNDNNGYVMSSSSDSVNQSSKYYFYVELVGDPTADETAALLRELDHTCRTVRLLGVYTK